jgi:hypothetical protein
MKTKEQENNEKTDPTLTMPSDAAFRSLERRLHSDCWFSGLNI